MLKIFNYLLVGCLLTLVSSLKSCKCEADIGKFDSITFLDEGTSSTEYPKREKIMFEAPRSNEEFRKQLGNATWKLLHTIAARYPESPDNERKEKTFQFFTLLSELYPCPECSKHMQENLKGNPPQLNSQSEFSGWLCDLHNLVNDQLGKAQFSCENVDSLYDCGCHLED